jgi:hypothetical protein
VIDPDFGLSEEEYKKIEIQAWYGK